MHVVPSVHVLKVVHVTGGLVPWQFVTHASAAPPSSVL
jgi:hypothetical protein